MEKEIGEVTKGDNFVYWVASAALILIRQINAQVMKQEQAFLTL